MIKILNKDTGKYISNTNKTEIKTKARNDMMDQNVIYSIQGQLQMSGKCITNNNGIILEPCDIDNLRQQWDTVDNQIVSRYDHKCLDDKNKNNENVTLDDCIHHDSTKWIIGNPEMSREISDGNPIFGKEVTKNNDNYSWIKQGNAIKSIVLVENDNPWYLNRDTTIPIEPIFRDKKSIISKLPNRPDLSTSCDLQSFNKNGTRENKPESARQEEQRIDNGNGSENGNGNVYDYKSGTIVWMLFILLVVYFVTFRKTYY